MLVNGARPVQATPSPPITLNSPVFGVFCIAITWQPMPAIANEPSGNWVEVLCGHPAQNVGARASKPSSRSGADASSSGAAATPKPGSTRARARATSSGEVSMTAGSNGEPSIAVLPTMAGRWPVGRL